jgi:hypothetical protein
VACAPDINLGQDDGGADAGAGGGTDAPLYGVWVDSTGTARAVGQGRAILKH